MRARTAERTDGRARPQTNGQLDAIGGARRVRRTRVSKELWLLFGSLAVAFLVCEFAARKFLSPPYRVVLQSPAPGNADNGRAMRSLHRADPLLGWALKSGPLEYRHTLSDKNGVLQYDVVYSVANGQRRTSEKPSQGPVVIAAGCSFTFGHALNDQDSWPWQLQEKLARDHVMNTADLGYGTDQALLAAERQVKLSQGRAAAVILGFGDFQIERNRAPQGWLVFVYPFAKPLFAIGPHGAAVYQRQVRIWSPAVLSDSVLFAHAMNITANRVYGIVSHEEARRLTAALIRTFAERFQASGVRLAVVMLPYAGDQEPQPRADRGFLIENLRAAHIPTLTPDFPRLADGQFDVERFMVTPLDKHPNREYNRILVNQLGPFLRSSGIVSQ